MATAAEQVRRWRGDIVAWAEENVWVRSPATGRVGPLQLAEHQRRWLTKATERGGDGHLTRRLVVASWP